MYEDDLVGQWVGKKVRMIDPYFATDYLGAAVEKGEVGKCVGIFCDCDGDVYFEVNWDKGNTTSWKAFRHEAV